MTETRVYKFVDREHVPLVLKGSLKFGRAGTYRVLEIASEEDWIGDVMEAVAVTRVNRTLLSNMDLEIRQEMRANGVSIEAGIQVYIDMDFYRVAECWIFSLAVGELTELTRTMCQAPDRQNYDGCIEVLDIDLLVKRIMDAPFGSGRRLSEVFEITHGKVRYGDDGGEREGVIANADPFAKSNRFRPQNEYRIVLIPRADVPVTDIFLEIDPTGVFSEQRVLGLKSKARGTSLSAGEALEYIRSVVIPRLTPGNNTFEEMSRTDNADLARAFYACRRPDVTVENAFARGEHRSIITLALAYWLPNGSWDTNWQAPTTGSLWATAEE